MLNLKIYFRVVSYPSYSAAHSKHRWLVIILFLIEFLWMLKKSLWHRTQTYLPNWLWPLCCTFPFLLRTTNFIHLFSSSGNISAFPLLLHRTDDSNSYLVVYSAHSIITIFLSFIRFTRNVFSHSPRHFFPFLPLNSFQMYSYNRRVLREKILNAPGIDIVRIFLQCSAQCSLYRISLNIDNKLLEYGARHRYLCAQIKGQVWNRAKKNHTNTNDT